MQGSNNHIKFDSAAYFSTPVWTADASVFLKTMLKLTDGYLKKTKKTIMSKTIKERDKLFNAKLDDFGLSNHSERSYEFLDWCGFNISNHSLHFTECWVQEFSKKGGGHHDIHTHWNQHVSGFYFLKCSDKTSMPVLHDPRPGAQMTRLPQKDGSKITFGNESVHYKVKPGTMVIIPGYTPHQYPVDMGLEPFRFIHWNIQAVPASISKETSMKKSNELSKK
jgi:hypothetical protein